MNHRVDRADRPACVDRLRREYDEETRQALVF
jgi:hypothetical protein